MSTLSFFSPSPSSSSSSSLSPSPSPSPSPFSSPEAAAAMLPSASSSPSPSPSPFALFKPDCIKIMDYATHLRVSSFPSSSSSPSPSASSSSALPPPPSLSEAMLALDSIACLLSSDRVSPSSLSFLFDYIMLPLSQLLSIASPATSSPPPSSSSLSAAALSLPTKVLVPEPLLILILRCLSLLLSRSCPFPSPSLIDPPSFLCLLRLLSPHAHPQQIAEEGGEEKQGERGKKDEEVRETALGAMGALFDATEAAMKASFSPLPSLPPSAPASLASSSAPVPSPSLFFSSFLSPSSPGPLISLGFSLHCAVSALRSNRNKHLRHTALCTLSSFIALFSSSPSPPSSASSSPSSSPSFASSLSDGRRVLASFLPGVVGGLMALLRDEKAWRKSREKGVEVTGALMKGLFDCEEVEKIGRKWNEEEKKRRKKIEQEVAKEEEESAREQDEEGRQSEEMKGSSGSAESKWNAWQIKLSQMKKQLTTSKEQEQRPTSGSSPSSPSPSPSPSSPFSSSPSASDGLFVVMDEKWFADTAPRMLLVLRLVFSLPSLPLSSSSSSSFSSFSSSSSAASSSFSSSPLELPVLRFASLFLSSPYLLRVFPSFLLPSFELLLSSSLSPSPHVAREAQEKVEALLERAGALFEEERKRVGEKGDLLGLFIGGMEGHIRRMERVFGRQNSGEQWRLMKVINGYALLLGKWGNEEKGREREEGSGRREEGKGALMRWFVERYAFVMKHFLSTMKVDIDDCKVLEKERKVKYIPAPVGREHKEEKQEEEREEGGEAAERKEQEEGRRGEREAEQSVEGYYEVRFRSVHSSDVRLELLRFPFLLSFLSGVAAKDGIEKIIGNIEKEEEGEGGSMKELLLFTCQFVTGISEYFDSLESPFSSSPSSRFFPLRLHLSPSLSLLLDLFLSPRLFSLSSFNLFTQKEVLHNSFVLSLLCRGIADIAAAVSPPLFSPSLLLSSLFPLLSKLGDPSPLVRHASSVSLQRISLLLSFPSVERMIAAHGDFVVDAVAAQLRERGPSSPLSAYLNEVLPLPSSREEERDRRALISSSRSWTPSLLSLLHRHVVSSPSLSLSLSNKIVGEMTLPRVLKALIDSSGDGLAEGKRGEEGGRTVMMMKDIFPAILQRLTEEMYNRGGGGEEKGGTTTEGEGGDEGEEENALQRLSHVHTTAYLEVLLAAADSLLLLSASPEWKRREEENERKGAGLYSSRAPICPPAEPLLITGRGAEEGGKRDDLKREGPCGPAAVGERLREVIRKNKEEIEEMRKEEEEMEKKMKGKAPGELAEEWWKEKEKEKKTKKKKEMRARMQIEEEKEGEEEEKEEEGAEEWSEAAEQMREKEAQAEGFSAIRKEDEERKVTPTPEQSLLLLILSHCRHLLSSPSPSLLLLLLLLIARLLPPLAGVKAHLFPAVAQLWPALREVMEKYRGKGKGRGRESGRKGLTDDEIGKGMKALEVIEGKGSLMALEREKGHAVSLGPSSSSSSSRYSSVFIALLDVLALLTAQCSRFLSSRFQTELWPFLSEIMERERDWLKHATSSASSSSSGSSSSSSYLLSSPAYRVQLSLLTCLEHCSLFPDLSRSLLLPFLLSVSPYLSSSQPPVLQQKARKIFLTLAQIDENAVIGVLWKMGEAVVKNDLIERKRERGKKEKREDTEIEEKQLKEEDDVSISVIERSMFEDEAFQGNAAMNVDLLYYHWKRKEMTEEKDEKVIEREMSRDTTKNVRELMAIIMDSTETKLLSA